MKKILLFLLLLPLTASGYDIEVQNAKGTTIYYNYINNGTELEVTFRGSYSNEYPNTYYYSVDIPEDVTYMNRTRKVTSIGMSAFYGCSILKYVTIPNSVKTIADNAFYGCSSLLSIEIPNNVTEIGWYAFRDCSGLTSITIGNSVSSIGNYAFYNCSGLTSITIPSSVTSIGLSAFYGCSGLTSVTIPNSVTEIRYEGFKGCSGLTSITIPNSVTSIGGSAFSGCSSLTSVTIPNSVTSIGGSAFSGCSSLTSVTIPNSVTSIGWNVFDGADIPVVVSLIEDPFKIEGKTSNYRTFSQNTFLNATLYVPKGTIEKYKATDGWKDFLFIEEGTGGGDTPETLKCETPTISYIDGDLKFSCETEDVKFVYNIVPASALSGEGEKVGLPSSYTVTVYATKEGYEDSDVATKEVEVSGGTAGIKGDVNEDGTVNGTDIQEVINIIVEGE